MSHGTKPVRVGRFLELAEVIEGYAKTNEEIAKRLQGYGLPVTPDCIAKAEAYRECAEKLRELCE